MQWIQLLHCKPISRLILLVNLTDDSRASSFWIYLIMLHGTMVLGLKKLEVQQIPNCRSLLGEGRWIHAASDCGHTDGQISSSMEPYIELSTAYFLPIILAGIPLSATGLRHRSLKAHSNSQLLQKDISKF